MGLGPRVAFLRLERSPTLPRVPADGVLSIDCFVVARMPAEAGSEVRSPRPPSTMRGGTAQRSSRATRVRTSGSRILSASGCTGTLGIFERPGVGMADDTTSKASGGPPGAVVRMTTRSPR